MADTQETAPRDFAALRALVARRADSLPKRLTQVAAYALANPDEIAFGTAASIAAAAEVQPSALVRFAHALGYSGFSDLQAVFRARLRERVSSYDERLARMREHGVAASRTGLLLDGFIEATERSAAGLRGKIDPQMLEAAVDLLAAAETVYVIGLRRSFAVAAYVSYAMGKAGIRNVLVDAAGGMGAEQIGFIGRRDAALAISFAPYAPEAVTLAEAAGRRRARIVAITDSLFSPIAAPAEMVLEVVEADYEGFRPLAATMALAMTLTVAVAARRRERPRGGATV